MTRSPTLSIEEISTNLDKMVDVDRRDPKFERTLSSPSTLKLPAGMPAASAVRLYALNNPTLAVVIDPKSEQPLAVFHPGTIESRLGKRRGDDPKSIEQLIDDLTDGSLTPLNPPRISFSITMHYCAIGQHYVAQSLCPIHE